MFRLWGKVMQNNHLLRDMVVCDDSELNRTRKVFNGLYEICMAFDLENPIWLDGNVAEFGRISRTRFTQHNFIETIPFDFLEIQVIEEDKL